MFRALTIDHYALRNNDLCFMVPQFNAVWGSIFRATLDMAAGYKKHCVDKLSFRVVSGDSSYKYTMSVLGQRKHGEAHAVEDMHRNDDGDRDTSGYHNVHVMMADKVFSCKPGFAEGVEELSEFMKSSATLAQRRKTRIVLFDTPTCWPLTKTRKVFPKVDCVGGDPMHACIDLEKYIAQSHGLSKDFRKVILEFNSEPSARFKSCEYFDVSNPVCGADTRRGLSDTRLRELHKRLHEQSYWRKPYVDFKQYCDDIRAITLHHADTCARPLPGSKGRGTFGDLMGKYMDSSRFHYYQNIVIYRAKSGLPCQFGTTPNEAVMFQLESYNANVLRSTRERFESTLDLFSFAKVISMHLKKLAPPGMQGYSPGTCYSHAMSLLRQGLANGGIDIPASAQQQSGRKTMKRPVGTKKRAADTRTHAKPAKRPRR